MRRVWEGEIAVEGAAREVAAAARIAPVVRRAYPVMMRIASFRGARSADVHRMLVDAVRTAAAAEPSEAERVLLRTLIRDTARLERATPRPEDWTAEDEPAVAAKQLEAAGARWEGWFKTEPQSFAVLERGRSAIEARQVAEAALSRLPLSQRVVIVLRDVGAWPAEEVSQLLLQVTPDVQRALLHNARTRVRRALEHVAAMEARSRV